MMLLEINGMDLNFSISDLIVLGGVLIPAIIGYTRLKSKVEGNSETIKSNEEKQKEDYLNIQNGKRAIKKELIEVIKDNQTIAMKRIDRTQEDMKEYFKGSDQKIVDINEKLNRILGILEK